MMETGLCADVAIKSLLCLSDGVPFCPFNFLANGHLLEAAGLQCWVAWLQSWNFPHMAVQLVSVRGQKKRCAQCVLFTKTVYFLFR